VCFKGLTFIVQEWGILIPLHYGAGGWILTRVIFITVEKMQHLWPAGLHACAITIVQHMASKD
jgi:hypothetical protein